MGDRAAIDVQELLLSVEGDWGLVATLSELYREDAQRLLDEIDRASRDGDRDAWLRAAHTLKGATAVFGAHAATEHVQQMEHLVRDGACERAAALRDPLRAEVALVIEELAAVTRQRATVP